MATPPHLAHRPDVARAFESLVVDIPPDATLEKFLSEARGLMDRFGGADPDAAMAGVTARVVDAGGVHAEYLVPDACRTDLRIVYLHGGAWIGGGLKVYRLLGAVLAKAARCPVLVPEYRLAPEHPYPAPQDDCVAAIEWAYDNGPDGRAPARLAVAGDSAGGNLAATSCIRLITAGRRVPDRLALLSGVLDTSQLDFVARHDPLCSAASVQGSYALYAQDGIAIDDPLISPIEADASVLGAFPPTLIQVSADEFLLEGSRRMAAKMMANGQRCVLSAWPLMPHAWHCFLDKLPEAGAALDEVADFLSA
jgi:epsilon-lactone hydrolase